MNRKQKKRLISISLIAVILSLAIGLILYALKQNINLFLTPTQLLQTTAQPEQIFRVGGYVKKKSVQYSAVGDSVNFVITDNKQDIAVNFKGVLPSLFREGQGVVVTGKLTGAHQFTASQVLAKHDEKYMPFVLKNELK